MELASYLNNTNATKVSTVLILHSFSPKINLLLYSYSPHNSIYQPFSTHACHTFYKHL